VVDATIGGVVSVGIANMLVVDGLTKAILEEKHTTTFKSCMGAAPIED
jgi:hypothetical protein